VEIPEEMLAAQKELVPMVMGLPNVRGIDVGLREQDGVVTDEIVLRVLVADMANVPDGIPLVMPSSDIPITIIEFDPQVTADLNPYPTLVGGISISTGSKSGTLGGIVIDSDTEELRGITCGHVVGTVAGITVFQPELTSMSAPPAGRKIGTVVRGLYVGPGDPSSPPFGPTDAAIFTIERSAERSIKDIGFITGTRAPQMDNRVMKRGKETLVTIGTITGMGTYGPGILGKPARYYLTDQFLVSAPANLPVKWCEKGDSGSLVVLRTSEDVGPHESTGEVVGIHWGGSTDGKHGLASDIEITARMLNIRF
jgi:hypothetical protein